jgi:hypothetical protein
MVALPAGRSGRRSASWKEPLRGSVGVTYQSEAMNKWEAEANARVKARRKQAKQAERARKRQQWPQEADTYHGGFWPGRVALWGIFMPIGLWRSVRHGKKQQRSGWRKRSPGSFVVRRSPGTGQRRQMSAM